MCQWEFDIIIIFNVIVLALQTSRVCLTTPYLIPKLLVLNSIGKLYDDRHLSQNRYFFLLPGLPYIRNGLLHLSHPFYFLYPSYLFHLFHPSNLPHIVFSHSWDQKVQYHGIYTFESLES